MEMLNYDFGKLMSTCDACSDLLKEVPDLTMFFSVLGVLVDQWTADTGADVDEVNQMLHNFADVHAEINAQLGKMEPRA